MPKLHHSLAQSRREELVRAIRRRGKQASNVWYVFAAGSRTDVVLLGDLRFELFLATEGDPDVRDVEYHAVPTAIAIGDAQREVQFDAIVRRCDGRWECRDAHEKPICGAVAADRTLEAELKMAAAEEMGARYREFTTADLDALQQRTRNWARAIAALSRCRRVELAPYEHSVTLRLADGAMHSLGSLIRAFAHDPPAYVVAAAVSLLRKRLICSDLDVHRWGLNTKCWQGVRQP